MLSSLRQRLHNDEDGFTLIELMVVVLIIAILIAIAIPTFLGVQDKARNRAAQSDLRNAMTNAKGIATDDAGLLTNVDAASLTAAEGALKFADGATAGTKDTIGVVKSTTGTPAGSDAIVLYKQSASDKWFGIATSKSGEVKYCTGGAITDVAAVAINATTGKLSTCILDKW
jgi:type IV pilus assembly protein PilA